MNLPYNKLFIKQKVEALEIFTNLEGKNRYRIIDESGKDLFYAYEESNFLARQLKVMRPLKITVIDNSKNTQFTIERPFTFLFGKYTVKLHNGQVLGYVEQKFGWFKQVFNILDANRQLIFQCIAKLPHMWTFNILHNNQEYAKISKKWSGLAKEAFTDADTLLVDFNHLTDNNHKLLVLAAAFAVDTRVFEK